MAYVCWNHDEKVLVCSNYLRLKGNVSRLTKKGVFVNMIQDVLPPVRRRAITNYKKFFEDLESFISSEKLSMGPVESQSVNETSACRDEPEKEFFGQDFKTGIEELVRRQVQEAVERETQRYMQMFESYMDTLVSEMVSKQLIEISKKTKERIDEYVPGAFRRHLEVAKEATAPQIANLKPKKRVVVIGLIGSQIKVIKETVGNDLELDIVNDGINSAQLRKKASGADYVVAMRKFISHKVTDVVNRKSHGGFIMVNGGTDELISRLAELC